MNAARQTVVPTGKKLVPVTTDAPKLSRSNFSVITHNAFATISNQSWSNARIGKIVLNLVTELSENLSEELDPSLHHAHIGYSTVAEIMAFGASSSEHSVLHGFRGSSDRQPLRVTLLFCKSSPSVPETQPFFSSHLT